MLDTNEAEWSALQGSAAETRRIDVWWRDDASSRLMLLLAYLITRTEPWESARIRLLGICYTQDTRETLSGLQNTLDEVRIPAEPVLVEQTDSAMVVRHSSDASLVFLPFRLHGNQPLGPFDEPLDELLQPLPAAVLVMAAQDIDLDAEPEEGEAAEKAHLMDMLSDSERLAELAMQDAEKAEAAYRKQQDKIEDETEVITEEEQIEAMTARLDELAQQAEKA
ncbi:MAG: amino acid permease, partial [Candidatus Thiodiazotropha sp.]